MKVGDLVRVKPYCKCGGELAIVLEIPNVINCVKIIIMRTGKKISSLVTNLEEVKKNEP